jgi:FkbH-like protein
MTLAGPEIAARRRRGRTLLQEAGEGGAPLTVVGSFNLDLLPPFLAEALDRRGLRISVTAGEFGQVAQQLLAPGEGDVLVVPAAEDLLAALYAGDPGGEELVTARLEELSGAVSAALERRPGATVYVVAFGSHRVPNPHVLDPRDPRRGQVAVERFVDGVRDLAALSPRVVVVDWDWHVRSAGAAGLVDDRLWYLGRMRLGPAGLAELADLVARHAAAYHGRARKVVAVDLDGTVWGGVVGEVGVNGLELGDEELGLAFREMQRELIRLHDTGTVLVAASKNNRADVVEAFEGHPAMELRLSHFAAERIDWQDKATNLREMAAELGLGLDSFVFLDDNPVEREWVRAALPEVLVPELPEDPAERPRFLRECGLFDRVTLTDADARRAETYKAQGTRTRLRTAAPSFEDFLRSLEQEVAIDPVGEADLPRAAQLCQRTNQFNLTTRRHTIADLERMLADERTEVFQVSVRDRFGDSGVTGLAILRHAGEASEIDTLLLSCRVLGRRVEEALLAFLARRAAAAGAHRLEGRFVPTAKNAQAAGFYPDHGFSGEDGVYRLALSEELPMPAEMTIRVPAHA